MGDLHSIETDINFDKSFFDRCNKLIDINISSDNGFVEVIKIVGRVDHEHIPSYKNLLSYRTSNFDKIQNARISVNKLNGIITFHSIIVYGLCHATCITDQYFVFESEVNKLQEFIKVYCKQQ